MLDQIQQNIAKKRPRLNNLVKVENGWLGLKPANSVNEPSFVLTLPVKKPFLIASAGLVVLYLFFILYVSVDSFIWPSKLSLPKDDVVGLWFSQQMSEATDLDGTIEAFMIKSVEPREYTVKKGDSLSQIAADAGLSIDALISYNNISNARILQTGQKLMIPNIDGIVHTVAGGETLAKIADHYKLKPAKLLDVNDLKTDVIQAGQKLFIPGAQLSKVDKLKAMGELFVKPNNGFISSYFGWRNDPFTGAWSVHGGVDFAAPENTAVWAAQDGIVRSAGWHPIYGNYVTIGHGGGYETLYGHLNKILVYAGQYVKQYQSIGLEGSTGKSTGPHVHFSVYKNGVAINPLLLLN